MRRIHFVTDVDLTEKDAQPVHVLSLAKYLSRLGLEIRLIYPEWKRESPNIPPGIIGVPIHLNQKPFAIGKIFQAKVLVELSRLPKPDVIYVRLSPGMLAPFIWASFVHVPLFLEVNGILNLEYIMMNVNVPNIKKWFKIQRTFLIERLNFMRAKGIIFVTENLKQYYSKRYKIPSEKSIVIPNGVDLEIFYPMDKNHVRNQLGMQDNLPIIGFIGLLAPWQGLDDAIFAIKILKERGIECRLYIIGKGSEENKLRILVENLGLLGFVHFMGPLDYQRVPMYINAFDICLVPKKNLLSGVSPLKLYEYMACGKPIVATNVQGLSFVYEIGAGVIAQASSPQSLAEAIEALVQRSDKWAEMGRKGRLYVETKASWMHVAEKTAVFIKNRLEHKLFDFY